jgi:hypothetical protein
MNRALLCFFPLFLPASAVAEEAARPPFFAMDTAVRDVAELPLVKRLGDDGIVPSGLNRKSNPIFPKTFA